MPPVKGQATFDDVVRDIEAISGNSLSEWLEIITRYYLTDGDLLTLDAMRTRYAGDMSGGGYKQRELSIMFTVPQWILSRRIHKVRTRIYKLYGFLSDHEVINAYRQCKSVVTPKQYALLGLLMAGNRLYRAAAACGVAKVSVTLMFRALLKRLDSHPQYSKLAKMARYAGKEMWVRSLQAK
jgi:hypothetical protein